MDQLNKEQEAWTKFHDLLVSIMNDQRIWSNETQTDLELLIKNALGSVCKEYINVLEVVALEQKPWLKQKH